MKRIANIIGWVGTVLVFAAVIVRFAKPDWDQYAIYGAWAGLGCLVLYVLGQYRDILDYFQKRQARYGALASASVIIVLGLLVAVNYLSARKNKRWDLTENQLFSLSEQTVKLLKGLDGLAGAGLGGLDRLEVDLGLVDGGLGHDRDLVGDDADEALVDRQAADLAVQRHEDLAGGDDRGDGLVAGQDADGAQGGGQGHAARRALEGAAVRGDDFDREGHRAAYLDLPAAARTSSMPPFM